MTLENKIKKFVEMECKKPSSKYGYDPYPCHFVPAVKYAEELVKEYGGDREIVVLATWLHDIGAIMHGRTDHHLTGAKEARKVLTKLGYPSERTQIIESCILNHRGSQKRNHRTIESKIVAEADVLSNFDNLSGIFFAAYVYEKLDQIEAKKSVREKLERKWRQLQFPKSREIIKPKYDAAMLLLRNPKPKYKLRDTTLVYLVQKERNQITKILIAMKKRGFGVGRWNGVGGKVNHEEGETVIAAAKREVKEGIGVKIIKMEKVAKMHFLFPLKPEWNQMVHVFLTEKWEGEPSESEEMKPRWCRPNKLPYTKMWPDDIFWMPEMIRGRKIKAKFSFAENDELLDQEIKIVDKL